ncbi:cation:proton antiporter [Kutzneria viridogrisea]|uniref:Cation/H+ exchanger transmembrane domain-containing protein n=2 Tax=Kutzneria TaxID=43356 RepID=W5WGE6_9PSEU|nr:cation:proton antiporter [Kutzneria albida]AHH99646.1 hypothetical protein KALB_6286 [Kutzneria albida DSM 43870]MBA8924822.1 Kef-type K+ transport system membrane component KefB [Kutzneria viridogrisea]
MAVVSRNRRRTGAGVLVGLLVLGGVLAGFGPGLLHGPALDPVAGFLLAVAVIVLVCHLFGAAARRLGQPAVIGEILGGLLLGPSALGALWPQGWHWLFPAQSLGALGLAGQMGLVTFIFLLGSELRLDTLGGRARRGTALVTAGAVGVPLLVGMAVALPAHDLVAGSSPNSTAYVVFFGLAMSITALPVLARILVDLDLQRSPTGVLALTCAAIGDGTAWAALTVLLAVTGVGGTGRTLTTVALAVGLVLVTLLLVRPLLAALVARADRNLVLPVLAAGAIGYAATTQFIGLHAVIGAFLFGLAVPRDSPAVDQLRRQLEGFSVTLLLPLFFAGIGLSTSVGLLGGSAAHWVLFGAVLLAASASKFLGTSGAARLAGLPTRQALGLGALMNCRGVTELVVASIGYQYHLVNEFGLTVLVLLALITTALTGPLMRLINR